MGNNGKYWEIAKSLGPFIGPVEIRGKKNKKKYIFLFSLLSTDGGLNLATKG